MGGPLGEFKGSAVSGGPTMTSPCSGTGMSVAVRGGAGRAVGRRDAGTRPAPWDHGVAVRAGEREKTALVSRLSVVVSSPSFRREG